MKKINTFIALIFILTTLYSCRKDKYKIDTFKSTPYQLNLPEDFTNYLPSMHNPIDNPLTEEGVELGRKLFYETKLSGDNTQSCSGCHMPDKAFSDTTIFSIGIDGNLGGRNAMPIINVGWMNTLFWDGRAKSVEDQAFGPVVNPVEMHNTWSNAVASLQADPVYPPLFKKAFGTTQIDSVLVVKAIAQFERILISGNSPFDKYLRGEPTGWSDQDINDAVQGYALFIDDKKGNCFQCHGDQTNPLWTDNKYHNNGLDATFTDNGLGDVTGDPNDNGKFKTPTLRNLAYTAPYMHDGRFSSLDEVLIFYAFGINHSPTLDTLIDNSNIGGNQISISERQLIKKFLLSLSDESFVTNPDFKKP